MQTKYYLSFEQVGIIRRIPLKEQDPDMQGILDAFIKSIKRQSIQLPFLVCRTSAILK